MCKAGRMNSLRIHISNVPVTTIHLLKVLNCMTEMILIAEVYAASSFQRVYKYRSIMIRLTSEKK